MDTPGLESKKLLTMLAKRTCKHTHSRKDRAMKRLPDRLSTIYQKRKCLQKWTVRGQKVGRRRIENACVRRALMIIVVRRAIVQRERQCSERVERTGPDDDDHERAAVVW